MNENASVFFTSFICPFFTSIFRVGKVKNGLTNSSTFGYSVHPDPPYCAGRKGPHLNRTYSH